MLKKALKLDQVHTFGDISPSQLLEKLDLMTEVALFNRLNSKLTNSQVLIVIISLAMCGISAGSDQNDKKKFDREVNQEIPVSPDST